MVLKSYKKWHFFTHGAIMLRIYGVVLVVFTFLEYKSITLGGFPDGYKTTYQLHSELPMTIHAILNLFIGFFFILLGFYKPSSVVRNIILILIHAVFFIFSLRLIRYYFYYYLGLEDGEGG